MVVRKIVACVLLGAMLLSLAACGATPQEKAWNSFLEAVSEQDADEALKYIDFERMAEKLIEDDPEMAAGVEFLGGVEGLAEMMEGVFEEAIESGDTDSADLDIPSDAKRAKSIETNGDSSTLTFEVDGDELVVDMEKIDGDWKIVGWNE